MRVVVRTSQVRLTLMTHLTSLDLKVKFHHTPKSFPITLCKESFHWSRFVTKLKTDRLTGTFESYPQAGKTV